MSKLNDSVSKKRLRENPEIQAVALAVLFLAVALAVLWLATEPLDLGGDAVLVSLLVLPALLYLALSGRLTEFTAGGVSAKFRDVAARPARAGSAKVTAEDVRFIEKRSVDDLRHRISSLAQDDRPIVFTFIAGGQYALNAVREYVDALQAVGRFLAVVFLEPEGQLLGYMPSQPFVALIRSDTGGRFIQDISASSPLSTAEVPGLCTETLPAGSTNKEALEAMTSRGLEILALIDENKKFVGIIERNRVMSELLVAATP